MSIEWRPPTAWGIELQNQLLFISMGTWLAWSSARSSNDVSHWLSTRGLKEQHSSRSVPVLPGTHIGMKVQAVAAIAKGVCSLIHFHLGCMGVMVPTTTTGSLTPNNLLMVWICRLNDLKATLCQQCLIKIVMRCLKLGSCAEEN